MFLNVYLKATRPFTIVWKYVNGLFPVSRPKYVTPKLY